MLYSKEYCEESDWEYEVFSPDEPAENFGIFSEFISIWQNKRSANSIPLKSDFDFYDFVGFHGNIYIVEVINRDPVDMKFRLFGSHLTEMYGVDNTGLSLSRIEDDYDEYDIHFLTSLAERNCIGRSSGPIYWMNREYRKIHLVDVPMSKDGTRVDYLLGYLLEYRPEK